MTLRAKWTNYAGLFLTTLSTLMFEILLTRIFSVIMWYHFAFMAVSVAMFGMTAGALAVFLSPKLFPVDQTNRSMALSSFWFSLSTIGCFLFIWFLPNLVSNMLLMVTASYVVAAIPFAMSGIIVCLALTRFTSNLSKLYASDLAGASAGCILLIYLLNHTDATSVIFATCCLVMLAAWMFTPAEMPKFKWTAVIISMLFFISFCISANYAINQKPIFHFSWTKGKLKRDPLYVKWNSFSRIQVSPDSNPKPFGWGFSPMVDLKPSPSELYMDIDGSAGTVFTSFNGNLMNVDHLRFDITNFAHYLRNNADIFVIGVGGGRDILSALAFQQNSVTGVEINENILDVMNKKYGDFTGHLSKNPRVILINDEARSYLVRQEKQFDVIQVSLIDTWAATAAGAFVLAENSLYTVDAWKIFLDRLTDGGILSFSRWYSPDRPIEVYKLVSLARAALMERGLKDCSTHLLLVTNYQDDLQKQPETIATLLVSKTPFSNQDLTIAKQICTKLRFKILLSPEYSSDSVLFRITHNRKLGRLGSELEAPNDNRPFFFSSFQWKTFARWSFWSRGIQQRVPSSTFVLAVLLILVIVLTLFCIFIPLLISRKPGPGSGSFLFYFAAIGMGFMLVEISQMQKLMIFLGHPTYSLSVVLFSLLLSGGIGSYLTNRLNEKTLQTTGRNLLLLLLAMLLIFMIATNIGVQNLQSASSLIRISFSCLVLALAGFMLGMAFPIGMKSAASRFPNLTPWFWGINGATSVCASVIAVVISISAGISTTFWTGFVFYGIAFGMFVLMTRKRIAN